MYDDPQKEVIYIRRTYYTLWAIFLSHGKTDFKKRYLMTSTTDYPLYAAAFISESTLVVGGGGGEGRHGVKNKLTSINVSSGRVLDECELSEGEDNPTCMAASKNLLFVGANRGSQAIAERKNTHLRVYGPELKERQSIDALKFNDPAAYSKAISACSDLVAIISDSPVGGVLQVLSVPDLKPLWSASGDFQDVSVSPNGRWIAAATQSTLSIFDAKAGNLRASHPVAKGGARWSRIAFTSDSELIAGANIAGKRARIHQLQIQREPGVRVIRSRSVPGKSLTGLKAAAGGAAVAVGTAGGDIYLYTRNLSSLRNFKNVLKFPVTALAVVVDEEQVRVAGTTLDGSYVVLETGLKPFSTTLWWVLVSTILIALLALISARLVTMDLGPLRQKGAVGALETEPDAESAQSFEAIFVDLAEEPIQTS